MFSAVTNRVSSAFSKHPKRVSNGLKPLLLPRELAMREGLYNERDSSRRSSTPSLVLSSSLDSEPSTPITPMCETPAIQVSVFEQPELSAASVLVDYKSSYAIEVLTLDERTHTNLMPFDKQAETVTETSTEEADSMLAMVADGHFFAAATANDDDDFKPALADDSILDPKFYSIGDGSEEMFTVKTTIQGPLTTTTKISTNSSKDCDQAPNPTIDSQPGPSADNVIASASHGSDFNLADWTLTAVSDYSFDIGFAAADSHDSEYQQKVETTDFILGEAWWKSSSKKPATRLAGYHGDASFSEEILHGAFDCSDVFYAASPCEGEQDELVSEHGFIASYFPGFNVTATFNQELLSREIAGTVYNIASSAKHISSVSDDRSTRATFSPAFENVDSVLSPIVEDDGARLLGPRAVSYHPQTTKSSYAKHAPSYGSVHTRASARTLKHLGLSNPRVVAETDSVRTLGHCVIPHDPHTINAHTEQSIAASTQPSAALPEPVESTCTREILSTIQTRITTSLQDCVVATGTLERLVNSSKRNGERSATIAHRTGPDLRAKLQPNAIASEADVSLAKKSGKARAGVLSSTTAVQIADLRRRVASVGAVGGPLNSGRNRQCVREVEERLVLQQPSL